jgi:predicted heme/steroid binding protein
LTPHKLFAKSVRPLGAAACSDLPEVEPSLTSSLLGISERNAAFLLVALVATVAIFNLTGCGAGSSTTRTGPPPLINGFGASPSTIEAGSSSSLMPVFNGGSGVITPGNIVPISGTPVSVSPTTTTTYTLTVTPTGGGAAATQQTTITVDPVPLISSFTATPLTIVAGNSASLTPDFTGGAGVITPGNITVTSGTQVSVSPTTTTTYILTVTPPVGTVNATAQTNVTVNNGGSNTTVSINPSDLGAAVTDQLLGMNMAVWFDIVSNDSAVVAAFENAGIKAVRWPGGSDSDLYHWATNTGCNNTYTDSNDTFVNFVNDIVVPAKLDLALTADYGTDAACTGPGQPSEAAAWVTAALSDGVTVSHMTVGNEEYGSWEEDMHSPASDQHNPTVYASEVVGSTGFYQSIKAASPNTLVGVVVDADNTSGGWDETVLANAKGSYDFVEYHFYPQAPGSESDTYLTQQAAQVLTQNINILKQELTAVGGPNTPIYVGEMGSVYTNPGKQTWSITQGLYAGQNLGEMMKDGISRATWWIGFGNCNGQSGNDSSVLYGWQDFGAYNVFSDGSEDPTCPGAGPIGTMSPTAVAFQLFSNVALNGEHVLTPTVGGDTTDVRAYAATHGGGTALVLFNLNETTSETVQVTVTGRNSSTDVKEYTYDKSIYDLSQQDVWNAPTAADLGAQNLPLTLTLTPWSMNVVIIQ